MWARASSSTRRCRPTPRADNFDFHGLLHEAAGFKFAGEFDHVGFWDLRVAVAEPLPGRARLHRRRCRAQPPALRWLRPQQRPRGRGQSRLEAGRAAAGLGRRRAAAAPTATSDGRSSRRSASDFIAGGIERDRDFLDRYNPERDRAEFEQAWNARQTDVGEPRAGLRAALRRLAGGGRPAGRQDQRPRPAHVQGAQPAIICRRRRCRPAATCSRSWAAVSRCWPSTPTTACVRRVRGGGARAEHSVQGRPRQLRGRPHALRGAADPGAARPVHRLDRRPRAGRRGRADAQGLRGAIRIAGPPWRSDIRS